jgi:Astacin (Peptidase family M12A)
MNLRPFEREVGCFRLYTIVHEFIHALGFFHQQAATERDEYVKIVWDKIEAGTKFNFEAYGDNIISNYVEYDYGRFGFFFNGNLRLIKFNNEIFLISASCNTEKQLFRSMALTLLSR